MSNPVFLEDTEKQIAPQVSKVRNRITHAAVWLTSTIQFALFKLPKRGKIIKILFPEEGILNL